MDSEHIRAEGIFVARAREQRKRQREGTGNKTEQRSNEKEQGRSAGASITSRLKHVRLTWEKKKKQAQIRGACHVRVFFLPRYFGYSFVITNQQDVTDGKFIRERSR